MNKAILTCVFFALVSSAQLAEDNMVRRVASRFGGKQYEFSVMQSNLDAAPLWKDENENPPLPARKAERIAREYVLTLPDTERWTVSKISLERVGREHGQWLYLVEFNAFPKENIVLLGPGHLFVVPVLMSGETVKPKVVNLTGGGPASPDKQTSGPAS